jgi:hypothetical protein
MRGRKAQVMATTPDVARTVEGAGDLNEAAQRLMAAGLSVAEGGNHIIVSGTVAVQRVGGNTASDPYFVVYDMHNPSKLKMKVKGGPSHVTTGEAAADRPEAH